MPIFLLLRAALLAVSFVGLCAALTVRFKLDELVAPFVAVSGIIVALMLAGMLRILFPAVCALYALGFAGALYAWRSARALPRWQTLLALFAFLVFLVWRFYFCPLWHNDDLSHWGLVARHLLRHDRFPVSADDFVFFQNYPLGTACFIYYVGRLTENAEGIYLVAQNFLLGMLYLPMFSLIRRRREALIPITAALFFLLFHYYRHMIDLQVEPVLGFFGVGAAAVVARYRREPCGALLAVIPAMIAMTFVKNSGLFFAILSAAMLACAAHRSGTRRQRALARASFALPLLAFLAWELHSKLTFPNALDTKHAVSLAAYAQQSSSKGLRVIAQIAWNQFRDLFRFKAEKVIGAIVMIPCSILLMIATRPLAQPRKGHIRGYFALAVAVYFLWYFLIFLMYVFSMPTSEALSLASMYRYNGAGLTYLIGMTAILLFEALQCGDALPRLTRWAARLSPLFIAAIIALTAWPGGAKLNKMFDRNTQLSRFRTVLQQLKQEYDIQDGDRILSFCPYNMGAGGNAGFAYYLIKYEYETDDIIMVTNVRSDPEQYYVGASFDNLPAPEERLDAESFGDHLLLEDIQHGTHAVEPIRDVAEFVAKRLDGADAFLILGDSPEFEAKIAPALAAFDGDTPVLRAHLTTMY